MKYQKTYKLIDQVLSENFEGLNLICSGETYKDYSINFIDQDTYDILEFVQITVSIDHFSNEIDLYVYDSKTYDTDWDKHYFMHVSFKFDDNGTIEFNSEKNRGLSYSSIINKTLERILDGTIKVEIEETETETKKEKVETVETETLETETVELDECNELELKEVLFDDITEKYYFHAVNYDTCEFMEFLDTNNYWYDVVSLEACDETIECLGMFIGSNDNNIDVLLDIYLEHGTKNIVDIYPFDY